MSPRRGRSQPSAARIAAEDARMVFVEEYRFLRRSLMSHEAIARKLGITVGTLQTRILRYDCLILSPAEQRIGERLDALIEKGQPFTLAQVSPLDDGTAVWLVGIALKRGRIRSSRTRAAGPRHPSVYTPVRSRP
ncbi:hypothetical protein [Nocardia anaemiae]|uniref:hypothetical protein n=1 Tax=Nocardia anaemiae TaxID=263910 RepID=UPI0007A39F9B|nr:hypothetical protein [Nocardia anaemiae]